MKKTQKRKEKAARRALREAGATREQIAKAREGIKQFSMVIEDELNAIDVYIGRGRKHKEQPTP